MMKKEAGIQPFRLNCDSSDFFDDLDAPKQG
jgi:hypothetical protein